MRQSTLPTLSALLLLSSAGCQQPPAPLTSVDGLSGGTITSLVDIDGGLSAVGASFSSLDADVIHTPKLEATNIEAVNATVSALQSEAVSTTTATVDVLTAQEVVTGELKNPEGTALLPTLKGKTNKRLGQSSGDDDCKLAFSDSHHCIEAELPIVLRGKAAPTFDRATVSSPTRAVGVVSRLLDGNRQTLTMMADNCQDWTQVDVVGAVLTTDAERFGPEPQGLTLEPRLSGRTEVLATADGGWTTTTTIECATSTIQLLCCD